jgi:hypothetical protein
VKFDPFFSFFPDSSKVSLRSGQKKVKRKNVFFFASKFHPRKFVPQKNKPTWRTKKQDGGRKQKRKANKGEKEKGGKKCHQTNYPGYVNNQVSSALKRFRLERFVLLVGGGGAPPPQFFLQGSWHKRTSFLSLNDYCMVRSLHTSSRLSLTLLNNKNKKGFQARDSVFLWRSVIPSP